jgi:hypothetical protein
MLKINIANLIMLVVAMAKFIMAKPTTTQLVMVIHYVKLIIMAKLTKLNQLLLNSPWLD